MPRLFHRFGFAWLDLRDARAIPCRESDFVDGGYHTNAACSSRMRDRLDTAAGLLAKPRSPGGRPLTLVALGDSIPAAVPRECGNCTGYVTLYARALSEAVNREVKVENLADPGSDSNDLRASLDADRAVRRLVAHADAVVVTTGRNDTGGVDVLQRNLHSILSTIRGLTRGRSTILRVTNFYDPDPGRAEHSRTICRVARRDAVPCADVWDAFDVSLLADGVHPNARGHRVIARLLLRLGFAPLASRS
jgi:lysophospholipase L1-like esterase